MMKSSVKLYVTVHFAWSLLLVANCGAKFVWSYDWTQTQDWFNTGVVAIFAIFELLVFRKSKQTKEYKGSVNKMMLCFDSLACIILMVVPPLIGNLTSNYIAWNIIIPLFIFATTALLRERLTR